MIRRLILLAALAPALVLGGCATNTDGTSTITFPSITVPTLLSTDTTEQIQSTANKICGFIPAASTVASIIATFTGGGALVDIVGQAARGICSAVTAKGVRRGGPAPRYRGVAIHGNFSR